MSDESSGEDLLSTGDEVRISRFEHENDYALSLKQSE